MKRSKCILPVVCLLAATVQAGPTESLKRGAAAYNNGDYAAAAAIFQQAVQEEPNSLLARQHLANARLRLVLAAQPASEREALAAPARKALQAVLALDVNNGVAVFDLATLEFTLGHLIEADEQAALLTNADPGHRNAWYLRGVIRWLENFKALPAAKADPTKRAAMLARVEEGHRLLERALVIDPEFVDAILYDSLLYRIEAELNAGSAEGPALLARAEGRLKDAVARKQQKGKLETAPPPGVQPDLAPAAAPPPPPPPPPPGPKRTL